MLSAIGLVAAAVYLVLVIAAVVAYARQRAIAPRLHLFALWIAAALTVFWAVQGRWVPAGIWLFTAALSAYNAWVAGRTPRRSS